MAEREVLDRLERLETALQKMHVILVRLEWKLEEAGVFPGSTSYASDEQRYALENNFQVRAEEREPPITDEQVSAVMGWLAKHEDEKDIAFHKLEEAFPGYRLKRILQFLYIRKAYTQAIERLATSFGGAAWFATDPYEGERKERK